MAAKKPAASTALVKWEDQLAAEADIAAGMEANTGGGEFFGLRSGVLTWQDAPLQNNEMAVVILDSIMENVYYEGKYDPETPQSPVCFAFGRDEQTIAPHELVVSSGNQQSDLCSCCDMNEWGSADTGRGKACRNTRRLAMIPAGTFDRSGKFEMFHDDHFESAAVGYMKLPVTSVKGYASFVKQVAGTLRRPPFGIVTKVKVVPDSKTQFKVVFEPIMNIPGELAAIITSRHEKAKALIDFPYRPDEEEQAAPKGRAAKKPAPKGRARKY